MLILVPPLVALVLVCDVAAVVSGCRASGANSPQPGRVAGMADAQDREGRRPGRPGLARRRERWTPICATASPSRARRPRRRRRNATCKTSASARTLAVQVADFFRACDAVCFAPVPSSEDMAAAAERLILNLENETC